MCTTPNGFGLVIPLLYVNLYEAAIATVPSLPYLTHTDTCTYIKLITYSTIRRGLMKGWTLSPLPKPASRNLSNEYGVLENSRHLQLEAIFESFRSHARHSWDFYREKGNQIIDHCHSCNVRYTISGDLPRADWARWLWTYAPPTWRATMSAEYRSLPDSTRQARSPPWRDTHC